MKILLLLLSFVILLSSCCIEGKMDAAKQVVGEFKILREKETQKVSVLKSISDFKLGEARIDTTIQNRIIRRLVKFQETLLIPQGYAVVVDSLLQNKRAFRKNFKTLVLPLLDSLKFSNAAYGGRLKLYLMIEDGLNIANYQLFDLAAFSDLENMKYLRRNQKLR
ncbi:MAG: hypothetical protein IPH18_09240 [Chitinophagaceae bacterium]|nr:hypothetical protein [Chitinophagaceae bacterium]